jgi:hypothetical protein
MAVVVAEQFLEGGWWNKTDASTILSNFPPAWGPINITEIENLQQDIGSLTRLENADCIAAYDNSLESKWRNVLVVTALHSNDCLLQVYTHAPDAGLGVGAPVNDPDWFCGGIYFTADRGEYACNVKSLDPAHWSIQVPVCHEYEDNCNYTDLRPAPVTYCLAEHFSPACTVRLSFTLLETVITCNVVKIVCLFSTLFLSGFRPLATIGDAMAALLAHPDYTNNGIGPISQRNVHQSRQTPVRAGLWKGDPERWLRAASTHRWIVTGLL